MQNIDILENLKLNEVQKLTTWQHDIQHDHNKLEFYKNKNI